MMNMHLAACELKLEDTCVLIEVRNLGHTSIFRRRRSPESALRGLQTHNSSETDPPSVMPTVPPSWKSSNDSASARHT